MAAKRAETPQVVELEHWDPDDGLGGEDDGTFDDEGVTTAGGGDEPDADDFDQAKQRAALPQPDRAKSSPDLPRVKSTSFKRFIS